LISGYTEAWLGTSTGCYKLLESVEKVRRLFFKWSIDRMTCALLKRCPRRPIQTGMMPSTLDEITAFHPPIFYLKKKISGSYRLPLSSYANPPQQCSGRQDVVLIVSTILQMPPVVLGRNGWTMLNFLVWSESIAPFQ